MSKTSKLLLAAALVAFGALSPAAAMAQGNTVQGQNNNSNADASSAGSDSTNAQTFQSGPSSTGGGSTAVMNGDTAARHDQRAESRSGDAVAGSQVGGVAGDGATLQMNANTTNTTADSAGASSTNVANLILGAQASAGTSTASASHDGDITWDGNQDATTTSGDALAGSQVTGIVGNGSHTVQESLNASDATAGTDNTDSSTNTLGVELGAAAFNLGASPATATQSGDIDGEGHQSAWAASGDSVASSQVTGIAGSGTSTIQKGLNTGEVTAGSDSSAIAGTATSTNNGSITAGATGFNATASQVGDDTVFLDQDLGAKTGDAVAGSQVDGVVMSGGRYTAQANLNASDTTADSGSINGVNNAALQAGPYADRTGDGTAVATQDGDNAIGVSQAAELASGDAVAGSQVAGAVVRGGDVASQTTLNVDDAEADSGSFSGNVNNVVANAGPEAMASDDGNANATQAGDNLILTAQNLDFASGDAVAGGQITGIVGTNSEVTIQKTANVDEVDAESGSATQQGATNDLDGIQSGPTASSTDEGNANATQANEDSNAIDATQDADLKTGDAVAGSQISGTVASGDDITFQMNLESDSDSATSGDVLATVNFANDINAGPEAEATGVANATANQVGASAIDLIQVAEAASGDAVAGSQIAGSISDPSTITGQLNVNSDSSTAETGIAATQNTVSDLSAGALAASDGADATANVAGDAVADVTQAGTAKSGDGVAGSQVFGVANNHDDSVLQAGVTATDADALSGAANSSNALIDTHVGAEADGTTAAATGATTADLVGDSGLNFDQAADSTTGDAVAGAQVVGSISSDDTLQTNLVSDSADADTATATSGNTAGGNVGPLATAGGADPVNAGQVGDALVDGGQEAISTSGDAVAGGQVIGVVGFGASSLGVDGGVSTAGAEDFSGSSSAGS